MMMSYLKVVVVWVVTQNRFLRRHMLPFSRPKMKAAFSSETSVSDLKLHDVTNQKRVTLAKH
jgi:hypothetical protein